MEVKKDEGMNVGTNPFYKPNNGSYGTSWQSSSGANPIQMGDIPLYSDIGNRDLALKNSNQGAEIFKSTILGRCSNGTTSDSRVSNISLKKR